MKKTSSAVGCFRYAQFVFVAEILLALYWVCVLTYASVHDHKKLLAGLIFGLHYAGLVALCALFDEITKEKNGVIRYGKPFSSWQGGLASYRDSKGVRVKKISARKTEGYEGDANEEEGLSHGVFAAGRENAVTEQNLTEKLNHYPLSYGVALFVAMISDLFSLVDAILDHEIGVVTYYLYIVLFAIGLCLTVSAIIWSFIFFMQMRAQAKRANENVATMENN
jgi:hypothetical protein